MKSKTCQLHAIIRCYQKISLNLLGDLVLVLLSCIDVKVLFFEKDLAV